MKSNLARLRQKKGITQRELANAIGVTERTIIDYENGKRPVTEALVKLADFYVVSTDYILGRTDPNDDEEAGE